MVSTRHSRGDEEGPGSPAHDDVVERGERELRRAKRASDPAGLKKSDLKYIERQNLLVSAVLHPRPSVVTHGRDDNHPEVLHVYMIYA